MKWSFLIAFFLLLLNPCSSESSTKASRRKQPRPHKPKEPAVTSYSYAVTNFGEKTGSHSKTIQVIKNYIGNHKPSTSDTSEEGNKSYSSVDTIVGYINSPHPTDSDPRYELEKLVDPSQVRYVEVEGDTNTTKRPRKKQTKPPKPTPVIAVRDREELTTKPPQRPPPKSEKIEGDVEFVETSNSFEEQSQSLGINKNLKYTVYDENKRDPKASISVSVFGRGTPSSIGLKTEKPKPLYKEDSQEIYRNFGQQDRVPLTGGVLTGTPTTSFEDKFAIKENVYRTVPAGIKPSPPSGYVNKIPDKKYSPVPPEIDLSKINFKTSSHTQREIIHSTIRPPNTITVTSSTGKRFDLPRSTSPNNLPPYVAPTKAPKPTPKPIFNVGITSTAIPYLAPNVRDFYQQKAGEDTGPIFFPGVGYGGILFNEQTGEPDLPQSTSPQRAPGLSSRLPPKPLYNYNRGFLFNLNASIKNPNYNNNLKPYTKTGRSRGFRFGG